MRNNVELLGHYGTDLTHALSAWTSTSRDLDNAKLDRVDKLLSMLASHGHHTPFEKSTFHFLVNVDQATHIHLLKHRIGVSINGESARYKELKEDKYLIPEDWPADWQQKLRNYTKLGMDYYHICLEELTPILGRKRAKESARFFRPFNTQITMDISFNFRSFYHFYNLRAKDDAQVEVQDIAKTMLTLIRDTGDFPLTLKAFNL